MTPLPEELEEALKKYLRTNNKVFIPTKNAIAFNKCFNIASKLFSEMDVKIEPDPLQMGAGIITIVGYDMIVRSENIPIFIELIKDASNFEIIPVNNKIEMNIVYSNVLQYIGSDNKNK